MHLLARNCIWHSWRVGCPAPRSDLFEREQQPETSCFYADRHSHYSCMQSPGSVAENQLHAMSPTKRSCVLAKPLWNPLPHWKPPVNDLACLWPFHWITWYKHWAFVACSPISHPQISGKCKLMLCRSFLLLWFCAHWWEEFGCNGWMSFSQNFCFFSWCCLQKQIVVLMWPQLCISVL